MSLGICLLLIIVSYIHRLLNLEKMSFNLIKIDFYAL
jgi:hypothetical protein